MANENIMGAPTEGLGQNVTFAFGSTAPQQLGIPGADGVRLGTSTFGGGSTGSMSGSPVDLTPDTTVEFLLKAGEQELSKSLGKAVKERYVSGMFQAMQGKAAEDIAKDQGFFTNLFGGADVVEGARTFNAHARAQETAVALESQMETLRTLPPDQAQGAFKEALGKGLTGDENTDAIVMEAYTRVMPGLMARQQKEHFLWRQEQAAQAQAESMYASGKTVQTVFSSHTASPEEKAAAAESLVNNNLPPMGQPDEAWIKTATATLVNHANEGDLHAVRAWQASALLDHLPARNRSQIERAVRVGESQVAAQYAEDNSDDLYNLAKTAADPDGLDSESIGLWVDSLNTRFRDSTGSSRDLISPAKRTGLMRKTDEAIAAANLADAKEVEKLRNAATKETDKAAVAQIEEANRRQAITQGDWYQRLGMPGFERARVEETANAMFGALPKDGQAKFILDTFKQNNGVFEKVSSGITGRATQLLGNKSPDFSMIEETRVLWETINKSNPTAAVSYFKDGSSQKLMDYSTAINVMRLPPPEALLYATDPARKKEPSKDMLKAVEAETSRGMWRRAYDAVTSTHVMGPGSLPHYQRQVAKLASQLEPMYGDETSVEIATQQIKQSSEAIGEFWFESYLPEHKDGDRGTSVMSYMTRHLGTKAGINTDNAHDVLNNAVRNAFVPPGSSGKTADIWKDARYRLFRAANDSTGAPVLYAVADVNGAVEHKIINVREVIDSYAKGPIKDLLRQEAALEVEARELEQFLVRGMPSVGAKNSLKMADINRRLGILRQQVKAAKSKLE